MSETQGYKISHEALETAKFALRSRIDRIEMMAEEFRGEPYWAEEHRKAVEALKELEAL